MKELVLSSRQERRVCPGCGWPADACHCSGALLTREEPVSAKITARLRLESRPAGKSVTIIDGLPRNSAFLEDLVRELKKSCGTGGHANEDSIELQGDQRERLQCLLAKKGWVVKG